MADAYTVIRRPLVTEKNMHRAETRNEYTFEVGLRANKIEIRKAVEELFNVKVAAVRTAVKKGLSRRYGFNWATAPTVKKAIVKLAEGYKIDLI